MLNAKSFYYVTLLQKLAELKDVINFPYVILLQKLAELKDVINCPYVILLQKLAELKDVINCPSDKLILGEYSNNPDMTGAKSCKVRKGLVPNISEQASPSP